MTTQTSRPEPKRLFIKTYGCQMNVYDSERMRDVLRPLGYQPVDTAENADLVVRPYPSDHRAVVATFSLPKKTK